MHDKFVACPLPNRTNVPTLPVCAAQTTTPRDARALLKRRKPVQARSGTSRAISPTIRGAVPYRYPSHAVHQSRATLAVLTACASERRGSRTLPSATRTEQ